MSFFTPNVFTKVIHSGVTQIRKSHTFSCFSFCLAKANLNPPKLHLQESLDLSYTLLGKMLKDQEVPFHSIQPFTTPAHQNAFTKGYWNQDGIESIKRDFEISIHNLGGTVKYPSDIGVIDDNSFTKNGPELNAKFKALIDTDVVLIPMFGEVKGKDVPPGKKKCVPHYISVHDVIEGRFQGYNPVNPNSALTLFPKNFLRSLSFKKNGVELPLLCFPKKVYSSGLLK
jgi:hypothetical protein